MHDTPETPTNAQRSRFAGFGLGRDAWGRLFLIDAEGRRHVGVEPVPAFPISDPGRWVCLVDAEGHELACVEDPASLPVAVREVLEDELAQRDFVPVIRQIVAVSSDAAPADWDVVTDRGPTRFRLESDDEVRRLGPNRALITDARGLRYLVPDTRALDTNSRRTLGRYL